MSVLALWPEPGNSPPAATSLVSYPGLNTPPGHSPAEPVLESLARRIRFPLSLPVRNRELTTILRRVEEVAQLHDAYRELNSAFPPRSQLIRRPGA
jgi:hypothetical protein